MKTITKYLITIGTGLAAALYVAFIRCIFSETNPSQIFAILSDSFTVPGVLLTGIGGLMFVSNEGGFDALSYGITSFIDLFRKEKKNKYKTFYDYKEEKASKTLPVSFVLISGLIFMALAIIMLLLYL